jgi:hypothetical protein
VLRLNDTEVRPGHRGEFRILVAARRAGLGQVRAYLAADILRRFSERTGLSPTVIDLAPGGEDDLRAVCAELNIHPPQQTLTPPVTPDRIAGLFPGGAHEPVFDLGIRLAGEADAAAPPDPDRTATRARLAARWIDAAGSAAGTDEETARPLHERLSLAQEPLSVRMTLMQHRYGEPLGDGGDLDGGDLDGAAKTIARWRELVARWARSPSGAMSRRYADAITAALAADLDTPAALREMDALAADPGEPDGVKFETFAAADRLFGLDLARDIGRLLPRAKGAQRIALWRRENATNRRPDA